MNEHHSDPQRRAHSDEEQAHPTAGLPREANQPPPGRPEPVAGQPAQAAPYAAAQPTPAAPVEPVTREQPAVEPVTREQPAVAPGAVPPNSWRPAAQPQPTWPGNADYGVPPQQPPAGPPPVPGAPQPFSAAQQLPAWAQPVVTQPRPRRAGRFLATGAAALLLALSAGGIGAWTALALDDDGTVITSSNQRPAAAAPVIDRSSLAQIAAAVEDSVVSIATGNGEGSGVVLTADGYVLTNNHVVASAQGGTVDVVLANGRTARAKIVGTDPRTDLAVVKADGVSGLTPAKFGDSGAMQVGDTVLALGSPLGLQGSVTAGIISAKDRTIRTGGEQPQSPFSPQQQSSGASLSGLLQTDAPINPGNSGGALVNTNGQVIGINTAIATSGQGQGNIGVGFAIPSNKADQVAKQLMKGEKVSHPALGVSVTQAEGGGALVRAVTPGGAAAKAGLRQGDVITELNGRPVNDSDDLVGIVQSGKVGDQLQVTFTRNGSQQSATVTLAEAS